MFTTPALGLFLSALLSTFGQVHGYIPASPTNDTSAAIQNGLNISDVSKLYLQWYSTGSFKLSETVSYQLVGADSTGFSQGVLLHFNEDMDTKDFTSTPWIALVPCDANSTNASQENDIFTLARDAGAKSALLYSTYSQECIINPTYADPANFDQVMDIFSTQSLTTATLIEYQFGQFGWKNESYYANFNTTQLNRSTELVNETLATNNPTAPGFIFATLAAYNATQGQPNDTDPDGDGNNNTSGSGGSGNNGLAMIVLYAITGCVAALFCIVIISGAVRAIRHPERYGPRARHMGGMHGPAQSRARGLTRAIVDSFPIVKFAPQEPQTSASPAKDIEAGTDVELGSETGPRDSTVMKDWEMMDVPIEMIERGDEGARPIAAASVPKNPRPLDQAADDQDNHEEESQQPGTNEYTSYSSSQVVSRPRISTSATPTTRGESSTKDVVPAAIGRETCPICIVDFEEGDDLRLLPCEGKHRFHQDCVDPWLLELSSSCPICRQDFQALEDMMSGESGEDDEETNDQHHIHTITSSDSPVQNQGRFTRYLRFARRRRDYRDGSRTSQHEQASGGREEEHQSEGYTV